MRLISFDFPFCDVVQGNTTCTSSKAGSIVSERPDCNNISRIASVLRMKHFKLVWIGHHILFIKYWAVPTRLHGSRRRSQLFVIYVLGGHTTKNLTVMSRWKTFFVSEPRHPDISTLSIFSWVQHELLRSLCVVYFFSVAVLLKMILTLYFLQWSRE